jgi:serine/threonine protein phosphatase 1
MAVYAIGDIHGCSAALKKLFDTAPFGSADTIVFLGDYIDRGPDSSGVIDFIFEARKKYNVITLRGNHEIMMMESSATPCTLEHWLFFGGSQTLNSYNIGDDMEWHKKIPREHWDFFRNTLPYHEIDENIFVHASLLPGIPLNEQPDNSLYWEHQREPPVYHPGKMVFCGHTPQKEGLLRISGKTVFVDTYAFGGKYLSCINVKTGQFWQADQKGNTASGKIELL